MGKTIHLLSQSQLIEAIKANDAGVLKELYTANYPKVEALVLKNSGSSVYAKDIYQEAFITVWTHVKQDKFTPQNDSALQGYLYRICKNKWTDVLRSKSFKDFKPLNTDTLKTVKADDTYNEVEDKKLKLTMTAFEILGQPCKQLLKTFYFEKKSLKEISEELNIEENTARNKKYRCMQKLRAMVLASK
ncbi:sigma-70 family RNA polymerase sigma factor [Hyunsoonleella flava]|uniref:Sigma-70 family RNA polymerase sigma factor n=1 Tax=Hyunsoonleella flava TaxID=2527939 RepID=A0A4Q9FGY1_9FLAO|nr:sigma-70 family RNA polymerase sigma factor [Hyunsoonleella flava]TBN05509.1 sigma-70 family RNA polymerase sigma factor [Hyunsoonleella flava]